VDAVLKETPLLASGADAFWTDWITQRAQERQAAL
jgi:hypothetical protein